MAFGRHADVGERMVMASLNSVQGVVTAAVGLAEGDCGSPMDATPSGCLDGVDDPTKWRDEFDIARELRLPSHPLFSPTPPHVQSQLPFSQYGR